MYSWFAFAWPEAKRRVTTAAVKAVAVMPVEPVLHSGRRLLAHSSVLSAEQSHSLYYYSSSLESKAGACFVSIAGVGCLFWPKSSAWFCLALLYFEAYDTTVAATVQVSSSADYTVFQASAS